MPFQFFCATAVSSHCTVVHAALFFFRNPNGIWCPSPGRTTTVHWLGLHRVPTSSSAQAPPRIARCECQRFENNLISFQDPPGGVKGGVQQSESSSPHSTGSPGKSYYNYVVLPHHWHKLAVTVSKLKIYRYYHNSSTPTREKRRSSST